ncbi:unnamed protein product, partial [Mesorhabditis belari]|uniref:C-type lectin domain-containing protein n=1 Tax=Mesorhabditis belari TaxID=2138241 RepID=A0AAF3ENU6_9BILA
MNDYLERNLWNSWQEAYQKPFLPIRNTRDELIDKLTKRNLKLSLVILILTAYAIGSTLYNAFLIIYTVDLANQKPSVSRTIVYKNTNGRELEIDVLDDRCGEGWEYFLVDGARGYCYAAFYIEKIAQGEAWEFCNARQSQLVSIKSQPEDEFVYKVAFKIPKITKIWLGLTYFPIQRKRMWSDWSYETYYQNAIYDLDNPSRVSAFVWDPDRPFTAKCIRCPGPVEAFKGIWYFLRNTAWYNPDERVDGVVCKKSPPRSQTFLVSTTNDTCDAGWILLKETNSCYYYQNFTDPLIVNSKMFSWEEAEENCLRMDSHLVSIHSNFEREFIKDLILTNLKSLLHLQFWQMGCSTNHATWIGLHKENGTREYSDETADDYFPTHIAVLMTERPHAMCNDIASTYADGLVWEPPKSNWTLTGLKNSRYICKKAINF